MDILENVRRQLGRERMLENADTVICALSGGADSVCLAHILLRLGAEFGVTVECAHFNHLLRGEESDRDEAFVRRWCEERGVKLHIGRGDAGACALERRLSTETAARELRYAFFDSLGDGNTRIATAHQADDNAETLLLHLVRGSGLHGLCGIPPVRGRYIRPLLEVTRADILQYLADNGLPYVEDSSNAIDDASRNRIRHQVMPVLRELNPEFQQVCVRTTRLLREDEQTLKAEAESLLHRDGNGLFLSASELRNAPWALASRAIRLAAGEWGVQPEEKHISLTLELAESGNPSAAIRLPCGLAAAREYDRLRIRPAKPQAAFGEKTLLFGTLTEMPELNLEIFYGEPEKRPKINGMFTTWFFKKERICGKLTVRPRMAGDTLRLPGRPGKTVKKWMIDERIPAELRNRIPVLADEQGVLAVYGLGADVRALADADSADAVIIIRERT